MRSGSGSELGLSTVTGPAATDSLINGSLHPRVLWRRFRAQSPAFQIACLYVFFEYIRPQSRFPTLDVLPWTMLVILAGVAAMLPETAKRGWTRSPVNGGLVAYFIVAALSLVFAEYPAYGLSKWDFLVPWLVIYVFLTNTVTSRDRFFLLLLVYVLCNLRLSQFGLRSWVLAGFSIPGFGFRGPVGWFQNQGELGIQMAMFAPLSLLLVIGLWHRFGRIGKALLMLVPLSAMLTAVGTNSRGAILAVGLGITWALLAVGVRLRNLLGLGLLLGIGFLLIGENAFRRLQTMGDDTTSIRRMIFIEDGLKMIGDHPITGIGYFNWIPYYIAHFPPVDNVSHLGSHQVSHNILIQVTAELGLLGLGVFLVLVALSFVINRRTRKMLGPGDQFFRLVSHGLDASMATFLLAGQFVTVLYYPYFWINLTLTVALHESCRRDLGPVRRVRGRLRQAASANGIVPEATVHARRAKGP